MIICPKPKTLYYKILQDTIFWYVFALIVLNFVMSVLFRKKNQSQCELEWGILRHGNYDM